MALAKLVTMSAARTNMPKQVEWLPAAASPRMRATESCTGEVAVDTVETPEVAYSTSCRWRRISEATAEVSSF